MFFYTYRNYLLEIDLKSVYFGVVCILLLLMYKLQLADLLATAWSSFSLSCSLLIKIHFISVSCVVELQLKSSFRPLLCKSAAAAALPPPPPRVPPSLICALEYFSSTLGECLIRTRLSGVSANSALCLSAVIFIFKHPQLPLPHHATLCASVLSALIPLMSP